MNHNETFLSTKLSKTHQCILCNYYTTKSSDLKKHLETIKHKKKENETIETETKKDNAKNLKCKCGLQFKSKTTLWRHKKVCNSTIENKDNNNVSNVDNSIQSVLTDRELVLALIKDNNDLKNMLLHVINIITKEHNTNN